MISEAMKVVLKDLYANAINSSYEYATIEHLTLLLIDEPSISTILNDLDVDIAFLTIELQQYLDAYTPIIVDYEMQPLLTSGLQRLLKRSIDAEYGLNIGTPISAFLSLFREKYSFTYRLFVSIGLTYERIDKAYELAYPRIMAIEQHQVVALPQYWEPSFDGTSTEQSTTALQFCKEIAKKFGETHLFLMPFDLLEIAKALYDCELRLLKKSNPPNPTDPG